MPAKVNIIEPNITEEENAENLKEVIAALELIAKEISQRKNKKLNR